MNLHIGENIKRLRQAKNITQERLAEYLNISAPAISKWERGETLPDITMIVPLASYFNVSSDELLGFDEARTRAEAQRRIDMYQQLIRDAKFKESEAFIIEARREFPHDFAIAVQYMECFGGGHADERPELLLANAEEFIPLCERILNECVVNNIRYRVLHVLAKIYKARGEYDKALACFDDFPSWFHAKGQLLEQLHEKYTDKFQYWANKNLVELLDLAFNKAGKVIWYTHDSLEKRLASTNALIKAIEGYIDVSGYEQGYSFLAEIFHEGGKVLNQEGYYDKACEYYASFLACKKRVSIDFDKTLTWMEKTPFLETLRAREDFSTILASYRKK